MPRENGSGEKSSYNVVWATEFDDSELPGALLLHELVDLVIDVTNLVLPKSSYQRHREMRVTGRGGEAGEGTYDSESG